MPPSLQKNPIHLGLGATAVVEPEFTGMAWYAGYAARHAADGREARLVSMHSFAGPWDTWEMHPEGSEVVLCTDGEMVLIQELGGEALKTVLRPGQYALNDPGTWHTADVVGKATAVFITAGIGTQTRPR